MERRITAWYSPDLGIEMPLVAYGHAGVPLLMFPTAAADFLEYERFLLIDAIAHYIEAGQVRAYAINSVNRYSLLNDQMPHPTKARLLTVYDQYVIGEVVPWIRDDCGDPGARPLVTGASLGAFLALNTTLKHPEFFRGCIAMSGSYEVRDYLPDYYDDDVYFNNPVDYLPNLADPRYLTPLREEIAIVLVTGQGSWENPGRSVQMAEILRSKGIPCTLDLWGRDVAHDWPWWRKMLDHYLGKLVRAGEAPGPTAAAGLPDNLVQIGGTLRALLVPSERILPDRAGAGGLFGATEATLYLGDAGSGMMGARVSVVDCAGKKGVRHGYHRMVDLRRTCRLDRQQDHGDGCPAGRPHEHHCRHRRRAPGRVPVGAVKRLRRTLLALRYRELGHRARRRLSAGVPGRDGYRPPAHLTALSAAFLWAMKTNRAARHSS